MRKIAGAVLVVLLLVGAAGVVAGAVGPNTFITPKGEEVQLTEEQRAELAEIQKEMLAIRKKLVQKFVDYGWLSEEEGAYLIDQLELREKYADSLDLFGGPFGRGRCFVPGSGEWRRGSDFGRRGMSRGFMGPRF